MGDLSMKQHKYHADIESLLARAHDELAYCDWDLKGELYTPVCFWSHQIAEKSLKALWLYYMETLYPLRHHLEKDLLDPLIAHNAELVLLRRGCQILDQYYIPTRYGSPSGPSGDYTREQAVEAMELVKNILDVIGKIVKV